MIGVTGQKTDTWALGALVVLIVAALAFGAAKTDALPVILLALAVVAVLVHSAVTGWAPAWVWMWVLSFGILDRWFWVWELPGFFNLSIPRILFVATLTAFFVHFLVRRQRVRLDRAVFGVMAVLLVYVALSATMAGWVGRVQDVRSAPYYRFFAAMLFPFLAFFLTYNTCRPERQIRWALVAVAIYGVYALFISYCQASSLLGGPHLRWLIWPKYINSAHMQGLIHFDRARGAFPAAGPQAVLLVFLFYTDLYLIRRTRGPVKVALAIQAVLTLPALVFTGVRAGYVAFAVCGIIWCLWAARGRFGWTKLSLAALTIVLAILMRWSHVTGTQRLLGGVGQRKPIAARGLLLRQSLRIVADKPLFGVGFGHFVEAQRQLSQDPALIAIYGTGALLQHNIFLNMGVETGLIGLGIYVALFVLLFRASLRAWRRIPPDADGYASRAFVVLFWVMLANYLTTGMFRDMLWDPFSNALLWSLAGLTVGLASRASPALADAAGPAGEIRPPGGSA